MCLEFIDQKDAHFNQITSTTIWDNTQVSFSYIRTFCAHNLYFSMSRPFYVTFQDIIRLYKEIHQFLLDCLKFSLGSRYE